MLCVELPLPYGVCPKSKIFAVGLSLADFLPRPCSQRVDCFVLLAYDNPAWTVGAPEKGSGLIFAKYSVPSMRISGFAKGRFMAQSRGRLFGLGFPANKGIFISSFPRFRVLA